MNWIKALATLGLSAVLAACGGGGGSSGASGSGGGGAGGTGTGAAFLMNLDVQRAGTSTIQISSTETVQANATVTTSAGAPVEGVVVTFSQSTGSLITFAPLAATALTDANGRATLDFSASVSANTGATTVQAAATVGTVGVAATRSIQITAGAPVAGGAPVPAAINFIGSVPSQSAIVIKGAGGNGRSESAILTFRIVDASNAPINAAGVDFKLNTDNGGAQIAQPILAFSNSDGLVKVTISSGPNPASIVVTAAAHSVAGVTSQSDTLIVSNSVPVSGGFEIVAAKYNLDGRKTGDKTTISAFVRDIFGNPVPDGVAVSFQTDYGVVASSTLGGCVTVNGICPVEFRVQDPRGTGIASVVASVRVGVGNTLTTGLQINMAGALGTPYIALQADGSTLSSLTLNSCKQVFELLLSDGNKHSTAANTTVSAPFASTGVKTTVKIGSPVLDQLAAGFPPTGLGIEVDLTDAALVPLCKSVGGIVANSPAFFRLEYRSPNGIVYSQRVGLAYPQ